uniref:Uncharacterized protein n=1 Tax=Oryza sativa subsp. japonica TaxID=39947 RepID=Q656D0_ORYSJ|nr:hypothetical protein [Oryza sativa Japonica Group]
MAATAAQRQWRRRAVGGDGRALATPVLDGDGLRGGDCAQPRRPPTAVAVPHISGGRGGLRCGRRRRWLEAAARPAHLPSTDGPPTPAPSLLASMDLQWWRAKILIIFGPSPNNIYIFCIYIIVLDLLVI